MAKRPDGSHAMLVRIQPIPPKPAAATAAPNRIAEDMRFFTITGSTQRLLLIASSCGHVVKLLHAV